MKPRTTPLPTTPAARVWTCDLGPAGRFPFRFPSYAACSRLITFGGRGRKRARETDDAWMTRVIPSDGALIGICWHHPDLEVVATPPGEPDPSDWTETALLAFGAAVADELQDLGWPLFAILDVASACKTEMARRYSLSSQAQAMAGFTPPPAPTSISS